MTTLSRLLAVLSVLVLLCGLSGVVLLEIVLPRLDAPELLVSEDARELVVVRDVRVFPGTDATTVLEHHDVHLEDGWVRRIVPTGGDVPEGAEVVEGAGHTLLPGLVDSHAHVVGASAPPWLAARPDAQHHLEAWLASGVTTVFDLGSNLPAVQEFQLRIARGAMVGPRLLSTGPQITAVGGHPTALVDEVIGWPLADVVNAGIPQAADVDSARAAVDTLLLDGADAIKIVRDAMPKGDTPVLSRELLAALVERTHASRRKAFVHVGSPEDAVTAAEVGADILAHQVYRGRLGPGDAAAIADAGAVMIPTMHVFTVSAALAEQRHTPSAMDRAMYPPAVLESVTGEAAAPFVEADAMATIGATLNTWEDAWADNLRLLHAAGVPFLVGTDAALPGVLPGPALHAELEALVDAGLSPTEALYGATGLLAATLGEGDFGTLVVGGPGEAVLVRGDPTTDIRATRDIVWVTRMGRRHTTVWNE